MANSILTDSIIIRESLMDLKNVLGMAGKVNRQYDDKFAVSGAKVGDTINIRKPSRYTVTSGRVFVGQDTVDQSVPLQLDTQLHVGMSFTSKDLSLSVDDFRKRYIRPAMLQLGNEVDYRLNSLYKKVPNFVGVPSATAFPSTLKGFVNAKAKLANNGAPKGVYPAVVNPDTEASLVNGLSGLFQSSDKIAQQYEQGVMGLAAGCEFSMSQNVNSHTIGALGGTPLMNCPSTLPAQGDTAIVTDGWTSSIPVLKEGDIISIAGVYAVNPMNRRSTGQLMQFVVTADVSSVSVDATIPIYPALRSTGQYQNIDAMPANNAAITIFGHASTYGGVVCPQNMVFHEDAFVLGCADLYLPKGLDMAARASDPDSGLSLRLLSDFDTKNDQLNTRIDILFGAIATYPELACRVVGQPA